MIIIYDDDDDDGDDDGEEEEQQQERERGVGVGGGGGGYYSMKSDGDTSWWYSTNYKWVQAARIPVTQCVWPSDHWKQHRNGLTVQYSP